MIRKKFTAVFLVLAWVSVQQVRAIQLGEARRDVDAKYNSAPIGRDSAATSVYRWDKWKLEIRYSNETVSGLVYTKTDPLKTDEIDNILKQNGGMAQWTPVIVSEGAVQLWRRADGATARRDSQNNRTFALEGGRALPRGLAVATPRAGSTPAGGTSVAPAGTQAPTTNTNSASESGTTPMVGRALPEVISRIKAPGKDLVMKFAVLAGLMVGLKLLLGTLKRKRKPKERAGKKRAEESNIPPLPARNIPSYEPPASPAPSLDSIAGTDFELVMGEVYRRLGHKVEIASGHGADGGIDLRLRKEGALVLVQCKHWKVFSVGPEKIREFYGVVKAENASRGFFVNSGEYTKDARRFAQGTEMDLLDGGDVRKLIASVTRPNENIYDMKEWIDEFRINSVITQPDCPYCHGPMVLKRSKGTRFWGCATYPRCAGKRDARMELLRG